MMRLLLAVLLVVMVGGCAAPGKTPALTADAGPPPSVQAVEGALARERSTQLRTFFGTIRAAGNRTTAQGVLDFESPGDFRVSALTEVGQVLFDARHSWAGNRVLRALPGVGKAMVEPLVEDMALAFRKPPLQREVEVKEDRTVVRGTTPEGWKVTYEFVGPEALLRRMEVQRGWLDKLTVTYGAYDETGWPVEMRLARPGRFYEMDISFVGGGGTKALRR